MGKAETIAAIKNADILGDDMWWDNILDAMTDKFAKGYLSAQAEKIGNNFSFSSEDFREEILEVCDWNIWDK